MGRQFIPKIEFGTGPTTIEFLLPPKGDPFGESTNAFNRTSTSRSGLRQVVHDYIEKEFTVTWSHISFTIKAELDTFFDTHALLGLEFKYFFAKAEGAFELVELSDTSFKPKFRRMTRKGAEFLFEVSPVTFRRIL